MMDFGRKLGFFDRVLEDAHTAFAPGKLLLFGEHAVVYGEPAVGLSLTKGVQLRLSPGSGQLKLSPALPAEVGKAAKSPGELLEAALGELNTRVDTEIHFGLPVMAGFGSSAALAVAALLAKNAFLQEAAMPWAELFDAALAIERRAHGQTTGVDVGIVSSGVLVGFLPGPARPHIWPIPLKRPIALVVGSLGQHGGTQAVVGRVAALKAQAPEMTQAALRTLGETSKRGEAALRSGDLADLQAAIQLAHGVLLGLGLVGPALQAVIDAAKAEGALAAKISGAGGDGGAFYALTEDLNQANALAKMLSTRPGVVAWAELLPAHD